MCVCVCVCVKTLKLHVALKIRTTGHSTCTHCTAVHPYSSSESIGIVYPQNCQIPTGVCVPSVVTHTHTNAIPVE